MDTQETRKWVKYLQESWGDAVARQHADDQQLEENRRAAPGERPTPTSSFQPHVNPSSTPLERSNPFGTPSSTHLRPSGSHAALAAHDDSHLYNPFVSPPPPPATHSHFAAAAAAARDASIAARDRPDTRNMDDSHLYNPFVSPAPPASRSAAATAARDASIPSPDRPSMDDSHLYNPFVSPPPPTSRLPPPASIPAPDRPDTRSTSMDYDGLYRPVVFPVARRHTHPPHPPPHQSSVAGATDDFKKVVVEAMGADAQQAFLCRLQVRRELPLTPREEGCTVSACSHRARGGSKLTCKLTAPATPLPPTREWQSWLRLAPERGLVCVRLRRLGSDGLFANRHLLCSQGPHSPGELTAITTRWLGEIEEVDQLPLAQQTSASTVVAPPPAAPIATTAPTSASPPLSAASRRSAMAADHPRWRAMVWRLASHLTVQHSQLSRETCIRGARSPPPPSWFRLDQLANSPLAL